MVVISLCLQIILILTRPNLLVSIKLGLPRVDLLRPNGVLVVRRPEKIARRLVIFARLVTLYVSIKTAIVPRLLLKMVASVFITETFMERITFTIYTLLRRFKPRGSSQVLVVFLVWVV